MYAISQTVLHESCAFSGLLIKVIDRATLYAADRAARTFNSLLNPIALRIVLIAKLRVRPMRAGALRFCCEPSFSKAIFAVRRFRDFRNHITMVVVREDFLVKIV